MRYGAFADLFVWSIKVKRWRRTWYKGVDDDHSVKVSRRIISVLACIFVCGNTSESNKKRPIELILNATTGLVLLSNVLDVQDLPSVGNEIEINWT